VLLQALENRCFMSVTAIMTEGGMLRITGTDGPDGVTVLDPAAWGMPNENGLQVYVDAPDGSGGVLIGEFSGVRTIHARMLGGDDALDCGWVDSAVAADGTPLVQTGISVFADMGDGNDSVWGGGGNDVLIGGSGDDMMFDYGHDASDDIFIGGDGNDFIDAFGGRNILLGGRGDDVLKGAGILIGGPGQN
jgi:Ca2+-binding RTX toxin-like protein